MNFTDYKVPQGKTVKLKDFNTDYTGESKSRKEARKLLKKKIAQMAELQDVLYADDKYSLLLIFQAMDAAGKDSAIKHVMSGVNPQGTQVFSFKQPSSEELDHDYLWRISKSLPERGRIGIFNRSHYEEVLIVRLHNLIKYQKIPNELVSDKIWDQRFSQIKNFEKHLYENGTVILKFFLHVSKNEQANRFLKRLENPAKNWKFSEGDLKERKYWDSYQACYQEAISATSTKYAPWYIIPADTKWYTRLTVSEIIINKLKSLKLKYPELDGAQAANIDVYKRALVKNE